MLKKFLFSLAALLVAGLAFAQVDVNKGDQAALDGVKGIGPTLSRSILDARKAGGDFKDWSDFQKRVKGVGDKRAAALSQAGLTVNGESRPGAPASAKSDKPNGAPQGGRQAMMLQGVKPSSAPTSVPTPAPTPKK